MDLKDIEAKMWFQHDLQVAFGNEEKPFRFPFSVRESEVIAAFTMDKLHSVGPHERWRGRVGYLDLAELSQTEIQRRKERRSC